MNAAEPKAVYLSQSCDSNIYLVIAETDGSFRRWRLTKEQAKKMAKEAFSIAID